MTWLSFVGRHAILLLVCIYITSRNANGVADTFASNDIFTRQCVLEKRDQARGYQTSIVG
jgi:hypothetical protein